MPPIALSSLTDVGRSDRNCRNASVPFDSLSLGGSDQTLASREGQQRGNFAEALQAANGMQSASGGGDIVGSDNFDTMLLDHLENTRPLKATPTKDPKMIDSTERLPSVPPWKPPAVLREASKDQSDPEDSKPYPSAQYDTTVSPTPCARAEGNGKAPRLRRIPQVAVYSLTRLLQGLWLLMKFLFVETCTVALLMVPHLIVLYDAPTDAEGTVATGEWMELTFVERVVQPLYALLAARCASHLVRAIMERWLFRILRGGAVLFCQCFLGWPLTILLWVPAGVCFAVLLPASGSEGTDVWRALTMMPGFIAATVWWIACAASRGAVELYGQLWLTKLTLNVFEDRTERANQANKALRRIFYSAWVAEDERRRAAEKERQRKREMLMQAAKKIRALAEASEKGDKAAAKRIAMRWKGKLADTGENADRPTKPGTLRKQGSITTLFSDRKKIPIMNKSIAATTDGASTSDRFGPTPAIVSPAITGATVSNSTTDASKSSTASASALGANSVILSIVDGIGHLNMQLTKLAGPLHFGTVFSEAHSLVEASKRARRVFQMIASQPELLLPPDESGQRLVDAKAMLEWAYRLSGSAQAMLSAERTASALSLSAALDEDGFVSFSMCPYNTVPRRMRALAMPDAPTTKPSA